MFRFTISLVALALAVSGCSDSGADQDPGVGLPSSTSAPIATTADPTTTSSSPTAVPESLYAAEIEEWQEANDVVGAVVLVVDGSGDPDLTAIGYSDLAANREMTVDETFRTGSITKIYTAALVM
ncbi:MAG: serine hydrolase, partial [Acidimicrobiia bacterium]|nr:serine hydrolase [Acidimicrobiia bacterium]